MPCISAILASMVHRDGLTQVAIRGAATARQPQVLWLLFQDEPNDFRSARVTSILQSARRGQASLNDLLEACRGRRVVGAAWGQILAGRTALVWPPRLFAGEAESTATRLLAELDRRLQTQQVQVAQAPLARADGRDATRLARHGYHHAADLLYLACPAEQFPTADPVSPLQFEAYQEPQRKRLMRLVEQTYAETQDIPALDHVRDMEDVLAGYQETGAGGAQRWMFVLHQGQDVGCLFLSDHPGQQQMELVYMGLTRGARGHAWGREITRHAQWLTRSAGRERLVLAVDAANGPAIATYAESGFVQWERRAIFLRVYEPTRF